jgi:CSLREA domain-containing protein
VSAIRYALILALIFLPASPFATTFPVTKTADTDDGTCDPDCSLREAIDAANTNPGADDVSVPAGFYLLTLGQLTVSDDVSIAGAGQAITIIDGNAADRVFEILAPGVVEISDVTIQNGYAFSGGGGGIRNISTLSLTNSTVSGNIAIPYGGGGIGSSGVLTITNSTVSSNTANTSGGGIASSGVSALIDSTVSGNTAITNRGGGLSFDNGYGSTGFTLTNSTVSGNTAFRAGGIYVETYYGYLTLTNTTVSGNTSSEGSGGGIASFAYYGIVTLTDSTVTGNHAKQGGAGIQTYGGGSDHRFTNTIVANNGTAIPNCSGTFDSLGYNLSDDTTCGFTEPTDLVVADAMLGPLQDNGGPTETHDLLPGSPAIDAGSVNCPPPATDQRGVARPQGTNCDIGSVEYLPEPHHAATLIAGAALLGLLYRRRARQSRVH